MPGIMPGIMGGPAPPAAAMAAMAAMNCGGGILDMSSMPGMGPGGCGERFGWVKEDRKDGTAKAEVG